jgi:hypothetical protein
MAAKANPLALLSNWKLQGAFDLAVLQAPASNGARSKTKLLGTVANVAHTAKGKVENKTDQVLFLLHTTKQEEAEAPYSLQVAKLDLSSLRSDLLAEYKKGLPAKPSLSQIARKCVPCP